MKLAMYQMCNAGSMELNIEKSISAIKEASHNHADLILFPEVQLTEFFPQFQGQDKSAYLVDRNSSAVRAFQDACRKYHIMAVPNLFLKTDRAGDSTKGFDASLLIGADGMIYGIQKMVHIAQAEQFYEQDYYLPSDDGFKVFDTPFGRIGIVVCFDRHYPESIRTEALKGADLILVPTVNTKKEPMEMFEQEIRVQAFQNSVFIAMCNRVGTEEDMDFAGESLVVSPKGEVMQKADDREQLVYAELPLEKAKMIRQSKPYTSLRRKEWYL